MIEEIHGEDDVKMQDSFQAYDGCRNKSNLRFDYHETSSFFMTSFENQTTQMNARLLLTFINAAETLLQPSQPTFSRALKATPSLLVCQVF
jgi:hypothetical protein